MRSTLATLLVVGIAVMTLFSCAQPAPETPPAETEPAPMETGPDPTVVDSDHYAVEFENDKVRIVRITYGPGETSVMHYHPESIAVTMTESQHWSMTLPDGTTEEAQNEFGDHGFMPAGQHLPTNLGSEPAEVVLVELKPAAAETAAAGETGPDSTVVDPDHYKVEFENERVRILRITYGPGEASVMHHHPANVAIFLTDQTVEFTNPDGSTQVAESKAGQAMFGPGEQHLPKNIGEEPLELVLIELKG
jgi:quercetin dioxygenase-like cupin family protein